jgi:O-antigen ligase
MVTTTAQQNYQSTWTRTNLWIAQVFLWIALIFLPFSHFIVNQAVALAAVFVLISGDYHAKWMRLKQYKSIAWIVLFVFIIGISISYSSTNFSEAFSIFNKYTKLLYIIPFLYICQSEKRRRISLNVLICSTIIAAIWSFLSNTHLVSTLLVAYHWPKIFPIINNASGFFVNPINVSVLDAFVIYLLLVRIFKKEERALFIPLLIIIILNLFYFNAERTGCLAAIVLSYVFILQHLSKKRLKTLLTAVIFFILFIFLVLTSGVITQKIANSFHEIKYFSSIAPTISQKKPSQEAVSEKLGSIGLRLAFTKGSLMIIKKHPLIGTGVGSFPKEYNRINGVLMPGSTQLNEPHNAFLFVAVQVGLIGLAIFLILLFMLLRDIHQLPLYAKRIGIALGVLFILNSLVNATVIDNTVGFLYVIITSILFSSLPYSKKNASHLKR